MKLPNPIKDHRDKKEAEKRRREEEAKKTQKRALTIGVGALAAIFIICGIGMMTEKDEPQVPDSSVATTIGAESTPTTEPPVESEPESSSEPAPSETPQSEPESTTTTPEPTTAAPEPSAPVFSLADIPAYSGSPYVAVNGNVPGFTDADLTTTSFETYSPLDSLGRCGVAYASIGRDLMPTEERGSIGQVKPSGWHTVKYNGIVDGNYLYNRCHLIGYQLTAENANTKNLITGTRYLNVEGMLPFENMVADYIKETNNHVLYRVTPVFDGDNLVASGVLMEAKSVEDNGDGILFNVYCYNVQPKISIDYATGDSTLVEGAVDTTPAAGHTGGTQATEPETTPKVDNQTEPTSATYILNTNTKKFHLPGCSSVKDMKPSNKKEFSGSRDDVIAQGYDPCKRCNP